MAYTRFRMGGAFPGVPPVWSALPTFGFTFGIASSFNLTAYCIDPNGLLLSFSLAAGTLPSGCFVSGSFLEYNATGPLPAAGTGIQFLASDSFTSSVSPACTVFVGDEILDDQSDWLTDDQGNPVLD